MTDLAALSVDERTTLAAAVAERLLPHFDHFHERTGAGSPDVLRGVLAEVRNRLAGGPEVTLRTMLDSFDQIQAAADHLTEPEPADGTLDAASRSARLAWYAAAAVTNAAHACVHGRVHEARLCLEYEESAAHLVGDVTD
ncbi:DUF416 family protein [Streptomyces sp. NPDC005485]|uniref:DUF416 family protein n=1 Tax=Streptomyces sp. NPDC005485 TaxID=3155591 RepID=UPI0033BF3C04